MIRFVVILVAAFMTTAAVAHPGHDDCPVQNSDCHKGGGHP